MSLVRFRPEAPHAGLAHLVERHLAKVEVASSSLVTRSIWKHSSAGRAPALQAGGHRFEPCCFHQKSSILKEIELFSFINASNRFRLTYHSKYNKIVLAVKNRIWPGSTAG